MKLGTGCVSNALSFCARCLLVVAQPAHDRRTPHSSPKFLLLLVLLLVVGVHLVLVIVLLLPNRARALRMSGQLKPSGVSCELARVEGALARRAQAIWSARLD